MFGHAARVLAVFAIVQGGCSASPSRSAREPLPSDTTNDPAAATGDAGTRQPADEASVSNDPPAEPTTLDDAGKPETEGSDASVHVVPETKDAGAVVPDTKDAGAEVDGYDPEKDDPWSVTREAVPNDHNFCLNSAFVEPGHYAGDVGGNTNDYANTDRCGDGLPSEGRDAWVKVRVPSGQTISVWANVKETGDFDTVLYLLAGSCGKLGTCVAGANDNLAIREHATWTNDTGAEATVHVVFDLLLPPEKLVETVPYYLDISVR